MLAAAGGLLADHGYAGTTIAAVAREAGVAPETVYAAFGNKRTLVGELVQTAVRGGDSAPASAQAGARAAAAATDRHEQVRLFAADVVERLERVGPVLHALATAAAEPGAGRAAQKRRSRPARRPAQVRRHAGAGGPLRTDAEAAAETVWALASPELHSMLTARRGWSRERYCDWLADTLVSALLP